MASAMRKGITKKILIWLLQVLVAKGRIFSFGIRALVCSMWDLIP